MKRVQNWRDYLTDDDPSYRQKFNKKKKLRDDDEYQDSRKNKKRSKKDK